MLSRGGRHSYEVPRLVPPGRLTVTVEGRVDLADLSPSRGTSHAYILKKRPTNLTKGCTAKTVRCDFVTRSGLFVRIQHHAMELRKPSPSLTPFARLSRTISPQLKRLTPRAGASTLFQSTISHQIPLTSQFYVASFRKIACFVCSASGVAAGGDRHPPEVF